MWQDDLMKVPVVNMLISGGLILNFVGASIRSDYKGGRSEI